MILKEQDKRYPPQCRRPEICTLDCVGDDGQPAVKDLIDQQLFDGLQHLPA